VPQHHAGSAHAGRVVTEHIVLAVRMRVAWQQNGGVDVVSSRPRVHVVDEIDAFEYHPSSILRLVCVPSSSISCSARSSSYLTPTTASPRSVSSSTACRPTASFWERRRASSKAGPEMPPESVKEKTNDQIQCGTTHHLWRLTQTTDPSLSVIGEHGLTTAGLPLACLHAP
jgi:hypothetical protein